MSADPVRLLRLGDGRPYGGFKAMASPWEVHIAGTGSDELQRVTELVALEVRRIEIKYSRYRDESVLQAINRAGDEPVEVDPETARLLNYAAELWRHSEGRFDITTGALRRVWKFDGSDRVPAAAEVDRVRALVGWDKLQWDGQGLRKPAGMEIDFGGIGKEYAVDRAMAIARSMTDKPVLINGGGDLAASAAPAPEQPWNVGIDTGTRACAPSLRLIRGAVATSGDAHRYLFKDGVRYGHVLDPRTGWPVNDAPRSVTVLADTCSEAGSHATIALLHGAGAEVYLQQSEVVHWVHRDPLAESRQAGLDSSV